MIRNLKILSLAAVVVFALTAVSSASAAVFHSEVEPTTLKGTQIGTDVFTTNAGTTECEEANYAGTQPTKTTETVEVAPTYSGCSSLSGFASAIIDPNGCTYKFHITTKTTATTYDGHVDIVCPPTKEITVTASLFGTSKCIIHIPPQTGVGLIEYHNEGAGSTRDVRVTVKIANALKYSQ